MCDLFFHSYIYVLAVCLKLLWYANFPGGVCKFLLLNISWRVRTHLVIFRIPFFCFHFLPKICFKCMNCRTSRLVFSGCSITAGPAGPEEEGGWAEGPAVSERVSGDAELEEPAGHGVDPVPVPGGSAGGRLTDTSTVTRPHSFCIWESLKWCGSTNWIPFF